jgi:uncharacterized protein (TIGR03435 family)
MVLEFTEGRCVRTFTCFMAGLVLLAMATTSPRAGVLAARADVADAGAPGFEVAAIKPSRPGDGHHSWHDSPGRLSIESFTLRQIIRIAYGLKSDSQVIGGPKWIGSAHFDIVAKADEAETLKMRKMNWEKWDSARSLMLQSLLAGRFKLNVSRGERDRPILALKVIRSGIKFKASPAGGNKNDLDVDNGAMTATAISMARLAHFLSSEYEIGGRVVIDRTGLPGEYDFKMNWTPDRGDGIPSDAKYPGLFTALKEQLGLELKPEKAPIEVIVVKSASRPVFD